MTSGCMPCSRTPGLMLNTETPLFAVREPIIHGSEADHLLGVK